MSLDEKLLTAANNLNKINSDVEAEANLIAELQDVIDNLPVAGDGSYDKGYEDAIQDEYDRFWDDYQDNGTRTIYTIYVGGFAGSYWTDETFKPKYDMVVTDATMMFRSTEITDLRKETIGISLDFSECKNLNYAFAYSPGGALKYLPTIDARKAGSLTSTFDSFGGTDLSLIVSETTGLQNNTFNYAKNLINLTISGTIGKSLSLKHAQVLSNASVQNIIDCLKDLTGTTAQTLTFHKNVIAEITPEQEQAIREKNWTLVQA